MLAVAALTEASAAGARQARGCHAQSDEPVEDGGPGPEGTRPGAPVADTRPSRHGRRRRGHGGLVARRHPGPLQVQYGYQYKDVPLWKYSSQSQMIHGQERHPQDARYSASGTSRTSTSSARTEPTVSRRTPPGRALDDCKDATKSALAVDAQNEAPHREIHVDAKGKPTLAWAFVVRSNDRARPFARRYWVAAKGEPEGPRRRKT